jgi:biopolymer transport protein ExbD
MSWQMRHQGSPKAVQGLTVAQIAQGLRDGLWSPTDEVRGPQDEEWAAIENHPQFAEVVEEVEDLPARFHGEEAHVDMNALIDVTMVLLIFFILTTTRSVAVQKIIPLPIITDAKTGKKVYHADQVKKYMITMQAVGERGKGLTIRVDGQPADVLSADRQGVDRKKLAALLEPLVRGQPPRTELLLEAQDVSWGLVVALQDSAKSAGVRIVHHRVPKTSGP